MLPLVVSCHLEGDYHTAASDLEPCLLGQSGGREGEEILWSWGRGVEGEEIQQEWSGGGERGRRDTT